MIAETPSPPLPRDPITRTVAMPMDTNIRGDIFGGWMVSQMDMAAGIVASRRVKGRCATIAIDRVVFHQPVKVGDLLSCYGEVTKVGRTSVTILIDAWVTRLRDGVDIKVTEAVFTYVSLDREGHPRPVDR